MAAAKRRNKSINHYTFIAPNTRMTRTCVQSSRETGETTVQFVANCARRRRSTKFERLLPLIVEIDELEISGSSSSISRPA